MTRPQPRPQAEREVLLECSQTTCPSCGGKMWNKYDNYRTVRTLKEVVQLRLKPRRCEQAGCERYRQVYRPESESRWALPQHEFGLDVIAEIGAMRYQEHRSVPEMHERLEQQGLVISQRSVSHLLDRYDELVAVSLRNNPRIAAKVVEQGRAILAIDGLQPDVGHEVLWVIRECLSGEILLARAMLSSTHEDLGKLLQEVKSGIGVPIVGVVSDGQQSIRKAVETSLPGVPHGLCHYHYFKEAAKPFSDADRHAKKELKKRVRGVRKIERATQASDDPVDEVVQGYTQAVRSALSDEGRPPLATPRADSF
jgi:hypothetical protein